MTKRTVLVACGTAVLAIAGYLTTSAKKYAAATSAYYKNAGGTFVTIFKGALAANVPHLTTAQNVGNTLKTAFFQTQPSGTSLTMFSTKTINHRIYYK